jgi:hypothetical protein
VGKKRTRAHKWLEGLLLLLFISVVVLVASGIDGEATPTTPEASQRSEANSVPSVSTSLRPSHSLEWEQGKRSLFEPVFP